MEQVRGELALANAQELINVSRIGAIVVAGIQTLMWKKLCYTLYILLFNMCSFPPQKINEKCYLKCVPKPGSRLESGEQVRK